MRVVCPATEREYAPEELVACLLRKLVDDAATYLGEEVEAAVVTVPAYFDDSQRQATRDAGRLAGLTIERILNEPTAAALAYGFDRSRSQTVLVFDLGGGTFDVSLLRIANGVFDVKATSGDTQLGGNDFDQRIVDWLAEGFQQTHGVDLARSTSPAAALEAAEKAKQELSGTLKTTISCRLSPRRNQAPASGNQPRSAHLRIALPRSARSPAQACAGRVADARLAPDDVDEVVLVGGSSRMPMVQQLVRTLVPREPSQNVNPDEVVAVGAAVQAGILTGELRDLMLNDVTPSRWGSRPLAA